MVFTTKCQQLNSINYKNNVKDQKIDTNNGALNIPVAACLVWCVPGVVTGDVVEERLGLVVVTVGSQGIPLFLGRTLGGLGLQTRVWLFLSVHRLFRLDDLIVWATRQQHKSLLNGQRDPTRECTS
jgi:hypothetical protein